MLENFERRTTKNMKFEDMLNTITLGDSYELIKNIPDKSIDCVYIDIPYLFESRWSKQYSSK